VHTGNTVPTALEHHPAEVVDIGINGEKSEFKKLIKRMNDPFVIDSTHLFIIHCERVRGGAPYS